MSVLLPAKKFFFLILLPKEDLLCCVSKYNYYLTK